jgi:hypothetical protein
METDLGIAPLSLVEGLTQMKNEEEKINGTKNKLSEL